MVGIRCIVLLLVFISCSSTDKLSRFCPNECVVTADTTLSKEQVKYLERVMGIGQCHTGVPVCDTNFNVIECNDVVLPEYELCDGIDNNCNGYIDENFLDLYPSEVWPPEDNPCPGIIGECAVNKVSCINGQWTCEELGKIELSEETLCDGLDNDCDGRIDENLYVGEFCFDISPEDWWKASNNPCRPGVVQCIDGQRTCVGQVIPSLELCDGIDNDCNGLIDDTDNVLAQQYDIVFIIDTSGSMCPFIAAVAGALDAYVEQFDGNTNFRFSIVIMTGPNIDRVIIVEPFTDLATIRNRILTIGCNGNGSEASLDSMQIVCDSNNPLQLQWRETANKLFFMFTDEDAQTYTNPQTTGQNVINSCLESQTLPFIWALGGPEFLAITTGTNGMYFTLQQNWQIIFDNMNSIIVTLCGS